MPLDEKQKKLAEELFFSREKKPSIAESLFFGKALEKLPSFPLEESAFLSKFKAFADKKIDPEKIDREQKIDSEVITGLGELGFLSFTIPKEHGGQGKTQVEFCQVLEELASRCSSTALTVNVHQSVGMRALLLFGTEWQKKKWLPHLASGKVLSAFALTEDVAGSDAANVQTKAVFSRDENCFYLTGRKQWITNGAIADLITVIGRTEEGKITAFLVTADTPGFKISVHNLEKMGMRGSVTSIIELENVKVPVENVLGPIGGGLKVALTVLDYGRTAFGAFCTGIAKKIVQDTTKYAQERIQFKRPLASFPLVKKKLADMAALTYAMDASTYLTAALLDAEKTEVMLEAALVKVFASEALLKVIYDNMQIFGGKSFFKDAPYERYMRDSRINTIAEGANDVLRVFISSLGLREVGMSLKQRPWHILPALFSLAKVPLSSPCFKSEILEWRRGLRKFVQAVLKALLSFREEVVERQLVLAKLAESAIDLYTSFAVLYKLEALEKNRLLTTLDKDLGKYYCHLSMENMKQKLETLFDPLDTQSEELADKLKA